jgi:hypothetical protein
MIDRLTDTDRYYGMVMNVEETKVMRISRPTGAVHITIDQNQLENVEYFSHVGSLITGDTRRKSEDKFRIAMSSAAVSKKKALFTSKGNVNLRTKLLKCYIWSTALCGAETWTLRKVNQKYMESFKKWRWRRMDKISWTDRVKSSVLHTVQEERRSDILVQ